MAPSVYDHLPLAWLWCVLLILLGLICLHPRVFYAAENFIVAKLRQPLLPEIGRIRYYLFPIALLLISQVTSGLTLWLIIRAVTPYL